MRKISNFLSRLKPKKPLQVNESPLFFTEIAIEKILKHLEGRPANVKSAFKVSVVYQKESIQCQVGFDDYKFIRKTTYDYPIPLIINEQDELFLRGSYIDYHEEEEAYFYYPNVHLEVIERKSESIFVFYLDRQVVSLDSPVQSFGIHKTNSTETLPFLLKQLFSTEIVESIFAENNFISIEIEDGIDKNIFEEKIVEIILSYFEKCGYPLYITENNIEARKFGK
jgi:hypothetical protein